MAIVGGYMKVKNIKDKQNISEKEWEDIHIPIQENLESYMTTFIVPEVIAFSIANAFRGKGLCDSSFEAHYRSMGDILLIKPHPMIVADKIFEILKIKYGLIVVDDSPMIVQEITELERERF